MSSELSIRVGKQNDIDSLASQSPFIAVKTNLNFRIRLLLQPLCSKRQVSV